MSDAVAYPQDRTCPYAPPEDYRPLMENRPLSEMTLFDGRRVWAVTGHSVARRLFGDPRLSVERWNPGFPMLNARAAANIHKMGKAVAPLAGVDGAEHVAQRRLLGPSFSTRRLHALRPVIQEVVDGLLDDMEAKGPPAELVGSFALPVPLTVLCHLLGVPWEDHGFFEEQSNQLLLGSDPAAARDGLMVYLRALSERKRREGRGEGVLDSLLGEPERPDGWPSEDLVLGLVMTLLVAGHETTTSMIALGLFTLLQHPARLAELRATPSLMPAAVDELLRLLSITDGTPRVAVEDIEVEGTTIRKGDGVLFMTSVINRDEDVYDEPESLDWHRDAIRNHVSFGFGMHQCIGQNLARFMLEISLTSLLERLPGVRLAIPAEQVPFKPGTTVQGITELPITW